MPLHKQRFLTSMLLAWVACLCYQPQCRRWVLFSFLLVWLHTVQCLVLCNGLLQRLRNRLTVSLWSQCLKHPVSTVFGRFTSQSTLKQDPLVFSFGHFTNCPSTFRSSGPLHLSTNFGSTNKSLPPSRHLCATDTFARGFLGCCCGVVGAAVSSVLSIALFYVATGVNAAMLIGLMPICEKSSNSLAGSMQSPSPWLLPDWLWETAADLIMVVIIHAVNCCKSRLNMGSSHG